MRIVGGMDKVVSEVRAPRSLEEEKEAGRRRERGTKAGENV